MSLPYLRCLLTSVLLWQKPGKLQRILVNGPVKYYEYLMSKADLSAVANLTAEEIRRKFAGVRKASATDAVDLALEHDPEQEDGYEVLAAAAAGVAAGSEVPQSDPELLQLNMPKESSRAIVVNGRSCQVYFDNYTHASGQLRAFVQCAAAPTTGLTTCMPEPTRVPVPEPKFPPKRLLLDVDKSSYSSESSGDKPDKTAKTKTPATETAAVPPPPPSPARPAESSEDEDRRSQWCRGSNDHGGKHGGGDGDGDKHGGGDGDGDKHGGGDGGGWDKHGGGGGWEQSKPPPATHRHDREDNSRGYSIVSSRGSGSRGSKGGKKSQNTHGRRSREEKRAWWDVNRKGRVTCPVCAVQVHPDGLGLHLQHNSGCQSKQLEIETGQKRDRTFTCKKCNKRFWTEWDLEQHAGRCSWAVADAQEPVRPRSEVRLRSRSRRSPPAQVQAGSQTSCPSQISSRIMSPPHV
ncbi:hypothetical protein AK812_SmicGene43292 [Symbiodinium microadriaticum]|uniref:Uncharacterized protein n=1 Tax=Symbiodinium microadriaticum TaxID=2951 RepID=A0A1Q9C1E3_SYMMI|nr:hypothetical protein AK812_SmicGene43292 [Symbiodinium microadriaticum]